MTHTKEPWPRSYIYEYTETGCAILCDYDYSRARDCVNALAGIEDPEAWVKKAKKAMGEK